MMTFGPQKEKVTGTAILHNLSKNPWKCTENSAGYRIHIEYLNSQSLRNVIISFPIYPTLSVSLSVSPLVKILLPL